MPFIHAYQRVTRGWADCDTWNLDGHFANVLAEAVEHLRVNKQGIPIDLTEEQWDGIMKEMVEGFRAYLRSDDTPPEFVRELETSTGWRKNLGINDREYDWEKINAYQKAELDKFHHGMKLFTEHFQSLWD